MNRKNTFLTETSIKQGLKKKDVSDVVKYRH